METEWEEQYKCIIKLWKCPPQHIAQDFLNSTVIVRQESPLRVISLNYLIISFYFNVKWNNTLLVSSIYTRFRMSRPSHKAAHSVPPHTLTRLAQEWLTEDTPNFDPAGVCVGSKEVEARLLCKTPNSVLAGSPFFTAVFTEVGCTVDWIHQEGAEIGRYYTLSSKAPRY